MRSISDKRAAADPRHNKGFHDMLQDELGSEWDEEFNRIAELELQRVRDRFGNIEKYRGWMDLCQGLDGTPSDKAERWKSLEILVERDRKKAQQRLFEDQPAPDHRIEEKLRAVAPVSRFYIRTKYKIPYHFGFDALVRLASYNVRQFLVLSSDLFDEMKNSATLGAAKPISPQRQQEIIEAAAEAMWENISENIQNKKVVTFMDRVAEFCKKTTDLPNSPYLAVTGIAISYPDLERLRDPAFLDGDSKYRQLAGVLSTCFARNILEQDPDARQGKSGALHLVMYINRIYCVKYGLPTGYGGWQEKSIDDLCGFLQCSDAKPVDATSARDARGNGRLA